jgi:hypothetical protein
MKRDEQSCSTYLIYSFKVSAIPPTSESEVISLYHEQIPYIVHIRSIFPIHSRNYLTLCAPISQTGLVRDDTTAKMPHAIADFDSENEELSVEEWENKLLGKKIGETSDATVRLTLILCKTEQKLIYYSRPSQGPSYQRICVFSRITSI